MRYVQLRAFHTVAQEGGFSRAAEVLGLTQPALSDQVRRLEQDYDVLLFDRRHKQVVLTERGRELYSLTLPLFEQEARVREFLTETRAQAVGTLRVVADSAYHVTEVLHRFRARFPGVQIRLTSGNSRDVLDALVAYRADIGVLGDLEPSRELECVTLGRSPIVAFASRQYPALQEESVSLTDLASHPLILRERDSRTRQKLEQAADEVGIQLTPAIEAEGREAVREIVASGAGIGFVSLAEFGHDDRLRKIDLSGARMEMVENVVCMRKRRDVRNIRAFLAMSREVAGRKHCHSR